MQMLSCLCDILAIFISELQQAAECVRLIADIVFLVVSACAQAQTHLQLKRHPTSNSPSYGAPIGRQVVFQQPRK
jgi:hypothetical protein